MATNVKDETPPSTAKACLRPIHPQHPLQPHPGNSLLLTTAVTVSYFVWFIGVIIKYAFLSITIYSLLGLNCMAKESHSTRALLCVASFTRLLQPAAVSLSLVCSMSV